MIEDLKSLAIYREVAKCGSFRAAAKNLALSPSVISQHISNLEERLNSKLMHRTTRKLKLTEAGEELLVHAEAMYQHAQTGFTQVSKRTGELTGKRRITLPSALLDSPWLEGLANFAKAQPKLNLSLEFTDVQQDLLANNIDLAFRTGRLSDSLLKCKKVGAIPRTLVASPEFFAKYPPVTSPQDLETMPWVYLDRLPAQREVRNSNEDKFLIKFHHNLAVNSVVAMKALTLQGLGISSPPKYMIENELHKRQLIQPIPEWKIPDISLYLVWLDSPENQLLVRQLEPYLRNFTKPDESQR